MTVMKNAARFQEDLIGWYDRHHRRLPWRETSDPYRIWVSEVMLQQTQVKTVIPYYENFIRQFPDIRRLATARLQDVLKAWEGLGYYARARNLHRAARIVSEQHNGLVPNDWSAFRKLPGVGDYIASAVQSIAFGHPYPVTDGNVKRVLARYFMMDSPVNHAGSSKAFQDIAAQLMDNNRPGLFNQAMMELGALICRVNQPQCGTCPVSFSCNAFGSDKVSSYPRRLKRKPAPRYWVAAGIVYEAEKILITQRSPEGLLGGLWELPGGKVNDNESAQDACIRELFEETGLIVEIESYVGQVHHAYTHCRIVMDGFMCRYISGEVCLNGPVDHRWVTWDQLREYPFTKASLKLLELMKP